MTKIKRENQYEGQMFSPGQGNFLKKNVFFDCDDELNKQVLHSVTTFSVDHRVKKLPQKQKIPLFS